MFFGSDSILSQVLIAQWCVQSPVCHELVQQNLPPKHLAIEQNV